jgi:hypothetical protein
MENVKEYIEKTEDKSVLTETQEIIHKHFKNKYPSFDLMIEKWMFQGLSDLYYEDSSLWKDHKCSIHFDGEFYPQNHSSHGDYYVVDKGRWFKELEEYSFGGEEFKNEVETIYDGYRGVISQMESYFVEELYDYSYEVVFSVFEIRRKLGSSILSDLLDKLFTRRGFVVPLEELRKPEMGSNGYCGGSFTHPKLQKNWCYNYFRQIPLTTLPMTDNIRKRFDCMDVFLDTKKVDFQNIKPDFSNTPYLGVKTYVR